MNNDLISRQAVIESICTWDKFGVDERGRVVRWYEGLEPYVHLRDVVMAIEKLSSAQPAQRWIPCSEKLPEEGQKCLVSDRGSITADVFLGHGSPYDWAVSVRDYEAWMPLPEPWRGGEDESDK